MKGILIFLIIFIIGCNSSSQLDSYNFEALKDTLHLDESCVFIEECSPNDMSDSDVVKAIFISTYYNEMRERVDTAVYTVYKDNNFEFAGRTEDNGPARELIDWILKHRYIN